MHFRNLGDGIIAPRARNASDLISGRVGLVREPHRGQVHAVVAHVCRHRIPRHLHGCAGQGDGTERGVDRGDVSSGIVGRNLAGSHIADGVQHPQIRACVGAAHVRRRRSQHDHRRRGTRRCRSGEEHAGLEQCKARWLGRRRDRPGHDWRARACKARVRCRDHVKVEGTEAELVQLPGGEGRHYEPCVGHLPSPHVTHMADGLADGWGRLR